MYDAVWVRREPNSKGDRLTKRNLAEKDMIKAQRLFSTVMAVLGRVLIISHGI